MNIFVCCHFKMAAYKGHVDHCYHKNMFFLFVMLTQLSIALSLGDLPSLRHKRAAVDPKMLNELNDPNKLPDQQGPLNVKIPMGGVQYETLKNIPGQGQNPKLVVQGNQPNLIANPGIVNPGEQGVIRQNFGKNLPLQGQNPLLGKPQNFGQRNVQADQKPLKRAPQFLLSESPECQEDLARHCNIVMGGKRHNFAILECLQRVSEIQITEECQHLIYMYKKNLTKDGRFESAGKEVCGKALKMYPDCRNEKQENRIPCLIEYMDNITEPSCQQFLHKMAGIIFSDYRYVYHFMESCSDDIEAFMCGRMDTDEDRQHEQGKTIMCLASKIGKLKSKCRKQLLRIAELQADDYHLDRPLFYACRDAREKFCEKVQAGEGRVFECLFKHKSEVGMPKECVKMLTIRQQLIAEDVKVEKTFYTACKRDMKEYGCVTGRDEDDSDTKRSAVLLCLENAMKRDKPLAPECMGEIIQMRKTLMEDYKITPDIVARCDHEIQQFCHGGLERGGKTLHCLMRIANPRKQKRGEELTKECKAALDDLLTEADVGENVQIDRVLMEACGDVLDKDCANTKAKGKINCLMENLDSDDMTDECEDRLLEIQYFLVRDFKLDPQLYKECHADAVKICFASENWVELDKPTASYDPMVFSCLYRHMKEASKGELSKNCAHEVRRVMRRRAKRIDLEPEIEENCLPDLGAFCSDLKDYGKGEEIACLQDNLESLVKECQDAVSEFTEDEGEDLDLDTKLMKACTPMIKKFCGDLLEQDSDATAVMDCLIENKLNHAMDKKCAAGVEHHQIIQLKDIKFSHKFREMCKKDIQDYCGDKNLKKKTDIIVCLSETVRTDVLSDRKKERISEGCREQLRVEVLRRGETIELDPELKKQCNDDIKQYCGSIESGDAKVIQCLKDNKPKLSNTCHLLIFKRQQDEAVLGADYLLFRVCRPMIRTYCKTVDEAADVIDCLKRSRNDANFDSKCRALLMKKILQETKDYRLNPSLAKNCKLDIPKFCSSVLSEHEQSGAKDKEFEGAVVNCLKLNYAKKLLSRDCTSEIRTLVTESHLDIDMDPVLLHKCQTEIKKYCGPELEEHEKSQDARLKFQPESTGDKVEECLLRRLSEEKIPRTTECGREVVRVIEESHIDVNVDPGLKSACEKDLTRFCQEFDTGEGRKMSCLLGALEEFPAKMSEHCRKVLSQRLALWEYAAKVAPAESMSDLAENVMQSPAKSYLLAVLMTIVGVIFIVGITCGRVTKRVTAENKNK